MPFRSQAQQRFAFGTGQPWAKRWADETDFSKLPKRVRRIRSRKVKGCTCGETLKGEQIAPGVTRIRGNLCNVHGKYGPCDKGLSGKKPKGGKGKAPKTAKPKQTPEQRAQARGQQQTQNRENVKRQMAENDTGLAPSGVDTLAAFASGQQPSAEAGAQLAKMGLAEQAADGTYRMTPTGRAAMNAINAGDYQRAVDTISRGTDTATQRGERQSAAAQRRQDTAGKRAAAQMDRQLRQQERDAKRAAAAAAKKPAGGGGGGKKQPEAEAKPTKRQARQARRGGGSAPSIGGAGSSSSPAKKPAAEPTPQKTEPQIAPALRDAVQALSDGADVSDEDIQKLITNGLVKLNKDGEPVLTAAGQRATKKEAREVSLLNEQQRASDHNAEYQRNKNTPAQIPEYRIVTIAASQKDCNVIEPMHTSSIPPSFTVYKDASGADRWLSVSSTAYRDRDREIVSTKALNGAVALADASGYRGPLRFWHVPGVELGDCDYQATAQDGRFLIESGTFRSPALAAAVKAHADEYQMSIGFTHPPSEPDDNGVFSHIAIFERSLVPRGRASNPLTQFSLVTKESRMLTAEKQTQLEKLLDGNSELLSGLLGNIATTDKAAQDQGVAYKEAPDLRALIRAELASLLSEQTEKAAPPEFAEAAAEDEAKADMPMEMAEDGMEMEAEADENMLTEGEIAAIASAVVQAITPLLDIEKKMTGYLGEMKTLMGGLSAQKDAALAEVKEQVQSIKAQVDDLSGSQPRIMSGGFRASQSAATVTTDETKLKDAQPAADPVAQSFGAFMTDLFGNNQVAPGA